MCVGRCGLGDWEPGLDLIGTLEALVATPTCCPSIGSSPLLGLHRLHFGLMHSKSAGEQVVQLDEKPGGHVPVLSGDHAWRQDATQGHAADTTPPRLPQSHSQSHSLTAQSQSRPALARPNRREPCGGPAVSSACCYLRALAPAAC